jgi:hypothetical protein
MILGILIGTAIYFVPFGFPFFFFFFFFFFIARFLFAPWWWSSWRHRRGFYYGDRSHWGGPVDIDGGYGGQPSPSGEEKHFNVS